MPTIKPHLKAIFMRFTGLSCVSPCHEPESARVAFDNFQKIIIELGQAVWCTAYQQRIFPSRSDKSGKVIASCYFLLCFESNLGIYSGENSGDCP